MSHYVVKDRFFEKAKTEGYRARSVYKLQEIQNRFHLIRSGFTVLDLGAAPGSFLQLISKIIGPRGLVVGADLKAIEPLKLANVKTLVADVLDPALPKILKTQVLPEAYDAITSDLAPATSGYRALDAGRSFELNHGVLHLAGTLLKPGGSLLLKLFPGAETARLVAEAKKRFAKVTLFKPEAVRKTSREEYLVALGKKA